MGWRDGTGTQESEHHLMLRRAAFSWGSSLLPPMPWYTGPGAQGHCDRGQTVTLSLGGTSYSLSSATVEEGMIQDASCQRDRQGWVFVCW